MPIVDHMLRGDQKLRFCNISAPDINNKTILDLTPRNSPLIMYGRRKNFKVSMVRSGDIE